MKVLLSTRVLHKYLEIYVKESMDHLNNKI
jgi:hypothetical protein